MHATIDLFEARGIPRSRSLSRWVGTQWVMTLARGSLRSTGRSSYGTSSARDISRVRVCVCACVCRVTEHRRQDSYLGLLYPVEDYRVYGYATNTRAQIVIVMDDGEVKEADLKAVRVSACWGWCSSLQAAGCWMR